MIHQLEDDVEDRVSRTSQYTSRKENLQAASSKLRQYAEQNPMKSILIGLGVGVGTGLVLGSILRGSAKYLTHDEALIERIGNNVKNSLAEMVPSSLTKHFRS